MRLTNELGKGYTFTALSRMRQFYILHKKFATVSQTLTWSHYVELLPIGDINKINYYITISEMQNLSVRELRQRIKNNEYERLDEKTKLKLINHQEEKVDDFIKNPILIKNKYDNNDISEKILKRLILEDLDSFLKELGNGFTYIGNAYPIRLGKRYNYIDILLFSIKDNRYIVCELKVTELKKEHIGQIETYMNYVDINIKDISHESTIGIIICKKDNKFIMKYVTNENIIDREYELI